MVIEITKDYLVYTRDKKQAGKYEFEALDADKKKRLAEKMNFYPNTKVKLYTYDRSSRLYYLPVSVFHQIGKREYNIDIFTKFSKIKTTPPKRQLRQWQKEFILEVMKELRHGGKGFLLYGKPGVGKTTGICALIGHLGKPAVIVAPTQRVRDQFYEQIQNFVDKNEVAILPSKNEKDKKKKVLIMTEATFNKVYDELNGKYPVLVIDEAHKLPPKRIKQLNLWRNKLLVLGATATPFRPEMGLEHFVLFFGAMYQVPEQDAQQVRIPAQVYEYKLNLNYNIDDILDKEDIDLTKSKGDRNLFYTDERYYDAIIEIVKDILSIGKKKIIILTEYVRQLDTLYDYLSKLYKDTDVGIFKLDGSQNSKQKEETVNQIKQTDKFIVVANEKSAKEGLDIPELEVGILAYPTVWRGAIEQALGRVERLAPGKTESIWIDVHIKYSIEDSAYKDKGWLDRKKAYHRLGLTVQDYTKLLSKII